MLDSIRLVDFKNHADTRIDLRGLTLLVGPNGAGKSGVLQGIHLVSQILKPSTQFDPSPAYRPEVLIRRGKTQAFIQLVRDDIDPNLSNGWVLGLTFHAAARSDSFGEISFAPAGPVIQKAKVPSNSLLTQTIREQLGSAVYLRFSAKNLAEPSYLDSVSATIDSDGYGLASTLAHLMTFERDRFEELEGAVRSVLPAVKRIRVRRVETAISRPGRESTKVLADELILDMRSGDTLPPQAISEGTLIFLGLLTVLVGPDCPRLLLIDDIDQSLHPRAQAQLISLLRGLIKKREVQIVATSHSPYLIDELDQEEVWLMSTRLDGTAAAACLAEHSDAERFRDVLKSGEFLSSVGEDWVLTREETDAAGTDR
ncbi:ATP-binding protein [uncultured Thiodictyon sp.]|uniref:AAA family ATPase n=1 Tax=uncultured Thiodictyon sp. TaxID=1846217 RepID=UPI0025D6B7FF|nr:ATP-binding protein [uncultured Thiodictyon sp.]